jgi:hypothetical protein
LSAETDYVRSWFERTAYRSGMTSGARRPGYSPEPAMNWEPGLASYGWCNRGTRATISGVTAAFAHTSSERAASGHSAPAAWQQVHRQRQPGRLRLNRPGRAARETWTI